MLLFISIVLCFLACGSSIDTSMYRNHIAQLHVSIAAKQSVNENEVALGHYLFFDTRLSVNNTKSCASCHNPNLFFTDGYKTTFGAFADKQSRNTPSLINVIYNSHFNWASKNIATLQQQMQGPLFDAAHIEMGLSAQSDSVLVKLGADKRYITLLYANNLESLTWPVVINAIAAYQKVLVSFNSAYDNLSTKAYSIDAGKGYALFNDIAIACNTCHGGKNFNSSDSINLFVNNAIHGVKNDASDLGLMNETKNALDKYVFRVPSLRNCMSTAPYMHNGSYATMTQLLKDYRMPNNGKALTDTEIRQLISFLYLLTDSSIQQNAIFQNPLL
jgi:cytochrome c peroxidase